ncbi:hypothetical protein N9W34_06245 [Rickettsiales bacterium]|nr:hypothetical protein [Rickettsiales bacterium]
MSTQHDPNYDPDINPAAAEVVDQPEVLQSPRGQGSAFRRGNNRVGIAPQGGHTIIEVRNSEEDRPVGFFSALGGYISHAVPTSEQVSEFFNGVRETVSYYTEPVREAVEDKIFDLTHMSDSEKAAALLYADTALQLSSGAIVAYLGFSSESDIGTTITTSFLSLYNFANAGFSLVDARKCANLTEQDLVAIHERNLDPSERNKTTPAKEILWKVAINGCGGFAYGALAPESGTVITGVLSNGVELLVRANAARHMDIAQKKAYAKHRRIANRPNAQHEPDSSISEDVQRYRVLPAPAATRAAQQPAASAVASVARGASSVGVSSVQIG